MPSKFQLKKTVCMAAFVGAVHTPFLHAQSMVSLGAFGNTETDSFASGVSMNGSVVVGFGNVPGNNGIRAFKYTGNTMTNLGTLGGTYSYAFGVSADGSVIVGQSDLASTEVRAFKYIGATMMDLGTLGGTYSQSFGVSADGSVIVGASTTAGDTSFRAFKYIGNTMTDLGSLGGSTSQAFGVSADGSVIVGTSSLPDESTFRAFKYTANTMVDLGTLGGNDSFALGVSADGSVIVGYIKTVDVSERAFKYTGNVMSDLGTLGGTNSQASGVSADGSVIVGYSNITGDVAVRAFKYTGNVMSDLGTLGGTNSFATGISGDGQVIVGTSNLAGDERTHAFVYGAHANGGLVDVQKTYAALATNGHQLNSLLNTQSTLLGLSLNSDCTVYGGKNTCVSIGGRHSSYSGSSTSQTAGNIQFGYRVRPDFRLGVFFDQSFKNRAPNNYAVKNSQPLAGLFAVYAPSGTNLGPQFKVSTAYSKNGVDISRTTLANTEGGQGTATLATQGAQLEASYGMAASEKWILAPFAGVKLSKVSRSAYSETSGATFPIAYNAAKHSAKTALAGARVTGYVTPKIKVVATAGVEHDINKTIQGSTGSIYYLGAFELTTPNVRRNRLAAAINVSYSIKEDRRLILGIHHSQQSLNRSEGSTVMLNYTVGF